MASASAVPARGDAGHPAQRGGQLREERRAGVHRALGWSDEPGAMVDDADIWRATNLLAKQYSEDAPLVIAQRADELLARADVER